MKVSDIAVSSYPKSTKIYVPGTLFPDIRVAMRRVSQYPTVTIEDGKRIEHPNEDITLYDTSGVYTDPNVPKDIKKGVPRLRQSWIERRGDTVALDGVTSAYGQRRLADHSLDDIRFHEPWLREWPLKVAALPRCIMRARV